MTAGHRHCMYWYYLYMYHRYTDTMTLSLTHRYTRHSDYMATFDTLHGTLLLHIHVAQILWPVSLLVRIHVHHFTAYRHFLYRYHHYMDFRHITVTHACMVSLFLTYGFPFILHVVLFHVIPVFLFYDCFPLLILLFPLLDIWSVDMRYVASHIYCFLFLVIMLPCIVLVLDILCSSYLSSGIPVISTVTPASGGTCVELSATRSKVPHHTYTWWGPPLESSPPSGVGWRGCLRCSCY